MYIRRYIKNPNETMSTNRIPKSMRMDLMISFVVPSARRSIRAI